MKNNLEKKINLFDCTVKKNDFFKLKNVFLKGELTVGENINKLEKNFKYLLGFNNIVSTSNLTSSIHLIFKILGISINDEILCTSFNCLSSTSVISNFGAKAVWVDFEKNYPQMSIDDCKKKITSKTKALFLYHVAGYPSNSKLFYNFCKKNKIILIEDVNSALGSSWDQQLSGSLGDFSVFSFYPNRIVNSIDGSIIHSKKPKKIKEIENLKKYGIDLNKFKKTNGEYQKHDVKNISYNYTLSNVNALLANNSLKLLNSRIKKIKFNIKFYNKALKDLNNISIVEMPKYVTSVNWVYFIFSPNSKKLIKYLKSKNIETTKLHYLNHRYSTFNKSKFSSLSLQNTIKFYEEIVCIPCGWWLTKNNLNKIVECLKSFE